MAKTCIDWVERERERECWMYILWHIIFNVGRILFWAHDSQFIRWFLMCRIEFGRNSNLFKYTCMCVCVFVGFFVCFPMCECVRVWIFTCACMLSDQKRRNRHTFFKKLFQNDLFFRNIPNLWARTPPFFPFYPSMAKSFDASTHLLVLAI